jgi:hypothetical protein
MSPITFVRPAIAATAPRPQQLGALSEGARRANLLRTSAPRDAFLHSSATDACPASLPSTEEGKVPFLFDFLMRPGRSVADCLRQYSGLAL